MWKNLFSKGWVLTKSNGWRQFNKPLAIVGASTAFLWYNSSFCPVTGKRRLDFFGPGLRDFSSKFLLQTLTNCSVDDDGDDENNVDLLTSALMEAFLDGKKVDRRHPGYRRLETIVKRIMEANPDKEIQTPIVHLTYEGKLINAYSLANHVVLSLNSLNLWNDDQLAFIIGHEMGHNMLDHHMENVSWLVLEILTGTFLFIMTSHKLKVTFIWFLFKPFRLLLTYPIKRDGEFAADDLGVDIMIKAGYDIHQVLGFWDYVEAKSPNSKILWFLMDHPSHQARKARIKMNLHSS